MPISRSQTCTIIDGMAAVQSFANSSGAKTFGEWSDRFLCHVTYHFSDSCTRVDVLFDRYVKNSIKGGTRDKRKEKKSTGIRRNVDNRDQRIGNWERFIILEDNKASLAHFLSTEISESYSAPPGRELVINGGFKETLKVWSSDTSRQDVRELTSDHEEADTRIVLHARDAAARGYKSTFCVVIQTFLSSFWHTESTFVKRYGCLRVHQDKGVTYLFTESRSPRRRGSRFWHFMQLLAVIRQASSMVWARHRHGKSSKMHMISWNTLEKKAKSVLTFLPKLKPLYANSTIR